MSTDRNPYHLHATQRQHYTPEAPQRGPRRIASGRDWLKVGLIVAASGTTSGSLLIGSGRSGRGLACAPRSALRSATASAGTCSPNSG